MNMLANSRLRLFSPGTVEWSRVEVPVATAGSLEGVRLLHLSDMHLTQQWYSAYDALISRINSAKLDLIAFTGDLIDNRWNPARKAIENARRLLESLQSKYGTFVILGNHDGDLLAPLVEDCNATLLHPGRATIDFGDAMIELIGLPCVHRKDLSPRVLRLFPSKPANAFRIVLSHYPDHVRKLAAISPDLVLAGHTHGGQVCLPGGRPIITHDGLPPEISVGLHRVNDCHLMISRGVGFATYPIRVFAPPQVVEVVLTRR